MVLVKGNAICSASAAQFIASNAGHAGIWDRLTSCKKYSKDIAHIYVHYFKNGLCKAIWTDNRNRRIVSFCGDSKRISGVLKDPRTVIEDYTGAPLEYYRVTCGLSHEELAKQTGISVQEIVQLERCELYINDAAAETLQKLSCALSCTVEDLMM